MKRVNALAVVLVLISNIATADQSTSVKIDFMKKIYSDRINKSLAGMDVVKKNSSVDLRQWINKTDAIQAVNAGEMCEWVYDPMIPGQDSDTHINQLKYTVLSNGRVRVQGQNFGEKFQIDYDIQCNAQGCKINDIYDFNSYKQVLKSAAQKKLC